MAQHSGDREPGDRVILDGLRLAQQAFREGDHATSTRVIEALLQAHGRAAVDAARMAQSRDQLGADLVLLETLGPQALRGDD